MADEKLRSLIASHEKWLQTDGADGEGLYIAFGNMVGETIEGKLRTAKFTKMLFDGCTFKGDFAGTEFLHCTLKNCKFEDAFLSDAQFALCSIEGTDFGTALNRTKFISSQILTPDVS